MRKKNYDNQKCQEVEITLVCVSIQNIHDYAYWCQTPLYLLLGAHVVKRTPTSSELIFSVLEIDLCLSVVLSFKLKHIPTNEAVKHDIMGDFLIWVEASKGYGVALRPAKSDCFR